MELHFICDLFWVVRPPLSVVSGASLDRYRASTRETTAAMEPKFLTEEAGMEQDKTIAGAREEVGE